MPSGCSALNCSEIFSNKKGITLHRFPKDVKQCKRWVINMRRIDKRGKLWQPLPHSRICNKHFKDEMFDKTGQTCRLRQNAVPTEFNFPAHLLPKTKKDSRKIFCRETPTPAIIEQKFMPTINLDMIRLVHSYCLPPLEVLKRKLRAAEEDRDNLSKRLWNTVKREKRLKTTCQNITDELCKQRHITDELKIKLDSYADFPVEMFASNSTGYTLDQREFALTLHNYSSKAYDYLRDKIKLHLPHSRTLRGWLHNVAPVDIKSFVCSPSTFSKDIFLDEDEEEQSPFTMEQIYKVSRDHDYTSLLLNSLIENTIVYITGWVVRKLIKRLTCDACKDSIVTNNIPKKYRHSFHLLSFKNIEGLFIPSAGCVKVIILAEKTIRQNLYAHKKTNSNLREALFFDVLNVIGLQDILELKSHIDNTRDRIDNHHYSLLRALVTVYFNMRQFHLDKLNTMS